MSTIIERSYHKVQYFFLAIIPFMILGFYHTFFGNHPSFYSSPIVVIVHITSLFLWCILFGVQVFLATQGKLILHKKLGTLSVLLVSVIVISMLLAAKNGYLHHSAGVPKPVAVKTLFHNYCGAFTFLFFYAMAIINGKTRPVHLRYMICTSLTFLGAAIYRINYFYFGLHFQDSLHFGSLMCVFVENDLVLLALIFFDAVHKKFYLTYWIALFICATEQILYFSFTNSPAWLHVVEHF